MAVLKLGDSGEPAEVVCPMCRHHFRLVEETGAWTIRTPRDLADRMVLRLGRLDREELWVLSLNAKNRVVAETQVYKGNVSAVTIRMAEVFAEPIRRMAPRIIVAHNHPSGDPTPGADDMNVTAKMLAAGKMLDIDVLDHVVVALDAWVSIRDRGVQFSV